MMPAWNASASFRFSTEGLSDAARAKAVRELYEQARVAGKIEPLEPLSGCPVRVDVIKLALPGLRVMSGVLCGLRQAVRPISSVSSAEDDLLLAVNLSGCSVAQQRDRELMLQNGDAVLATRGLTGFTITRPTPVRFMGFRVPRQDIAPLVGRLDDAPIRVVPHGTTALNLLISYARGLINDHPLTPRLQPLVVTHFQDLIAAAVGATRDAQAIAEGRGIRAARLSAIIADITTHLDGCDLTAAGVAKRQGVTPRYVHKIFEGEGLTFSAFVLDRRLAWAHRMLSDARLDHRNISSIAFDVGFGDLSHFNRAFRRRYGATPSEIRQSHTRASGRDCGLRPRDLGCRQGL